MTAIQATSAGVRDMADGSLRITLEFDPRYSKEAYALFGARGTACAVAALTQAASVQAARDETVHLIEIDPASLKPGPLCILACRWCKDAEFWAFLRSESWSCFTEAEAQNILLSICGVSSRRDIDSRPSATESFHTQIREPFMEWKAAQ